MTQCSQSARKQGPGIISGNYATNIVELININTFLPSASLGRRVV